MQLTEDPFDEIRDLSPKPRGNIRWGHRRVLNGILYVLQHGLPLARPACVLWALEHGVCPRWRCWAECGVLAAVFERWRDRGLVASGTETAMLDSTSVKVYADGTGGLKNGPQSIGRSRGGLTTKLHLLALDERWAWSFSLSAGHRHDAPEERSEAPEASETMDRAYEDDQTRRVVEERGATPVVPPRTTMAFV